MIIIENLEGALSIYQDDNLLGQIDVADDFDVIELQNIFSNLGFDVEVVNQDEDEVEDDEDEEEYEEEFEGFGSVIEDAEFDDPDLGMPK
jgi:hypothetical protein